MANKTREMKQYVNILQRDLNIIQSSKTYKTWQAYCTVRKYIKSIGAQIIKRIVSPKGIKKAGHITYFTKLPIIQTIADVSIVIPTYNGASTLPYLLKAISTQTNLLDPEIIIIDSGSTDNTVDIAADYGAKIISIKKHEFNHGLTRNLGAASAKGKYIIFTVQDAIPLDNKTYSNLLTLLNRYDKIAACSTKQISYPDADLFARWQILHHNHSLQLNNINFVSSIKKRADFFRLPFLEKRKISLLDDVCSAVKKNIFVKLNGYKKMSFAEDLDFSLRALFKGYSIGFTGESGVIHSHSRPIFYFLQRYYADNKIVLRLLKERQKTKFQTLDELVTNIMETYIFVKRLFSGLPNYNAAPNYLDSLKTVIINKRKRVNTQTEFIAVLSTFSSQIRLKLSSTSQNRKLNLYVFDQFRSIYNSASRLIEPSKYDYQIISEFIDKIFTILLGNHLVLLTLKFKDKDHGLLEKKLDNVLLKNI